MNYSRPLGNPRMRVFFIDLTQFIWPKGKENSYPFELSGGQQQRVAIARACMLNPSILCFDEPTSALDEQTRGQISKIIRNLASQGIAIIIVTHDNAFVDEIAQRIITMKNGKITTK